MIKLTAQIVNKRLLQEELFLNKWIQPNDKYMHVLYTLEVVQICQVNN